MDVLGVRKLPFITRRNFVYEFVHLLPWSVLAGLVEGQFAGVVVSKTFHGSSLLIAIAAAMPYAAYVTSLFWGMLCVGRPKVRLSVLCGAGTALCAGVVGAIPQSNFGAIWFVAQIAAAQIFLAGVVTVRAAIWKSNYPPAVRGQIAARLQRIRSVVSIFAVQAASASCDQHPSAYRFVYPAAAVLGLVGVALLTRVRIRRERAELRAPAAYEAGDPRSGMVEPFSMTALLSPGHAFGQMWRVLRDDRRFARYCVAQSLHGAANLMTIAIIVEVISRDLALGEQWGFWISSGLITALPVLSLLGSLERWGAMFDSLGVLRFRVVNVICWTVSLALGLAGTTLTTAGAEGDPTYLVAAVAMFGLRGVVNGVAQGGGALAWNLGHLHFATAENAEVYMGVHVFLAGVRGLIAPLGGMWLWTVIGGWVWLIAIGLALGSLSMYSELAKDGENAPNI
ncbi:MAG: hypothetical protein Q7R41_09500 [Phycisphaerales bacterium]|nr:hypothetical protein [Phycisphaerales bacterium]